MNLFCLDGRDDHAQKSAVENRLLFNRSQFGASLLKSLDDLATDVHVAHFASLELHHHAHLVSCGQEAVCMLDLGFEIVRVDAAGKLDLLELDDLLLFLCFLFAFFAFEAELAVIHDLTYGRRCLRCHQYKIKSLVICHFQCLGGAHNTERLSVGSDQTNLFGSNLLIEKVFFLFRANSSTPPSEKNKPYKDTHLRTAILHLLS